METNVGDLSAGTQSPLHDFLLLQRVAQRIGVILDLEALLEQIVEDVASTFGYSRSAVLLLDENEGDLVIAAVRGWTSNYHVKGDRFPIGHGMVGHVAATGRMHYAPDVTVDPHYVVSEETTRSEVDIPIYSRGRLIGVFNAQHPNVDAFPPHRLLLLEALAGHVGVAVENARLFKRERREHERLADELAEARVVQTRLFPDRAPDVPGFRIAGLSKPCLAVGGDWFDYLSLADGRIGIVVGDVSGKGSGAALLMASTRSILRMQAEQTALPGAVLQRVNGILTADLPATRFVTMIYAVLDPILRTVTFANAGHMPPILVTDGAPHVVRTTPHLPLGIREGSYADHVVSLNEGDRLFLYSDGVVEARSPTGDEYGQARLLGHVAGRAASAQTLLQDVTEHAAGHPAKDDITIVAVDAVAANFGKDG